MSYREPTTPMYCPKCKKIAEQINMPRYAHTIFDLEGDKYEDKGDFVDTEDYSGRAVCAECGTTVEQPPEKEQETELKP